MLMCDGPEDYIRAATYFAPTASAAATYLIVVYPSPKAKIEKLIDAIVVLIEHGLFTMMIN